MKFYTEDTLPYRKPAGLLMKTPPCFLCNKRTLVLVSDDEYMRIHDMGANIQDLFPELTADERELLKTGIHSKCWDEMGLGDD